MGLRELIVLLVCCCIQYAAAQKKQIDCVERKDALDGAVNNMTMLINENVNGYQTVQQFESEYCSPFLEWLKTYNAFKGCLTAFPRQLFSFVGTNLKKLHKQFCTSQEKMQLAYDHLQCFNPSSKPVFMKVGTQLKNFVEFISSRPDVDDIIPSFCCGYMNLTRVFPVTFEKACTEQGKSGSGVFISNVVITLLTDAVDIMCGKYQKPEDCTDPKMVQTLDTMVKQSFNKTTFDFKSVVIPVLKMLERMDGKLTINE